MCIALGLPLDATWCDLPPATAEARAAREARRAEGRAARAEASARAEARAARAAVAHDIAYALFGPPVRRVAPRYRRRPAHVSDMGYRPLSCWPSRIDHSRSLGLLAQHSHGGGGRPS